MLQSQEPVNIQRTHSFCGLHPQFTKTIAMLGKGVRHQVLSRANIVRPLSPCNLSVYLPWFANAACFMKPPVACQYLIWHGQSRQPLRYWDNISESQVPKSLKLLVYTEALVMTPSSADCSCIHVDDLLFAQWTGFLLTQKPWLSRKKSLSALLHHCTDTC